MTRTGKRSGAVLWLALALSAVSGCHKPSSSNSPSGGLKVVGSPNGPVAGRVVVRVAFDHRMVDKPLLGQAVASPPARISPPLAGVWSWSDDKAITFTPDGALPRATSFTVEVPAGTAALDGTRLGDAVRFSFETPRPEASLSLAGGGDQDARWARLDQQILLQVSQPSRIAEVARLCRYVSDKETIKARAEAKANAPDPAAEPGEAVPESARFVLSPEKGLAGDTKWTVTCDAGLPSTEGPLVTEKAATLELRTYGPFKLLKSLPEGNSTNSDDVDISLVLSTPPAERAPKLEITPPVAGFPDRLTLDGATLEFHASSLTPGTAYTIKFPSGPNGMKDIFGQTLPEGTEVHFTTGDADPRLDVETGAWVVEASRGTYVAWQRNLAHVQVDATAVPEGKLTDLFGHLNWWDDSPVDLSAIKGLKFTHKTINLPEQKNHWQQLALDPKELTGGKGSVPGVYYLVLRDPDVPDGGAPNGDKQLLLNFTNLGVTAKLSASDGLVWVTRLDTAATVAGADVVIRNGRGKVMWQGKTDADGLAKTPGIATLNPGSLREDGGDDSDNDFADGGSAHKNDLYVFARSGGDVTWVNTSRGGPLAGWNFNVSVDSDPQPVRLRGFLHTDRGLYRPGDTVHLRGLARTMRLGEGLRVPASKEAKVTVSDPTGREVLSKRAPLSRFGGFSLDVPIAADSRLGDYRVRAVLPEGSFTESFAVEEYRAAAFEVKAKALGGPVLAGDRIKLEANARYFFGSPVRGAQIKWSVYSRARTPDFANFGEFSFSDATHWESDYDRSRDSEYFSAEEEGTLDKSGTGKWRVAMGAEHAKDPRDLLVEATVTDETNQAISAHVAIPVHPASVYVGVDIGAPISGGGTTSKHKLRVVTVDPEGKPVAGQVTARMVLRKWSCAWEAWGYHGSYRCEKSETESARQVVSTTAAGPATVELAVPGAGEYVVFVDTKDSKGRPASASSYLWAWGDDDYAWRADDSARFDLVADKKGYVVGDTAKLLVKSPYKSATALITVERQGVVEHRLMKIEGSAPTIEVPIRDEHVPNVYVSCVLVKGRGAPGPRGLPALRMGITNLPVESGPRRLSVSITTDRESYKPGEKVTATVEVKDSAGKPVAAEVALAAADEGVLSLIGFKTPDPIPTFYSPWGLGVSTSTQYDRIARLPEPGEERYATGGDGGRLGTFRSRFLATAYWNPHLETDAGGKATVTFDAPDNLTAYRLMAVVADLGDRFGDGERRFTVRKPLQLLPAWPRFLSVGDEARGAVVVVNETGAAGSVHVTAQVAGSSAKLIGATSRDVNVPAGGRMEVPFTVHGDKTGEARLRFMASLGSERDGVEVKLPVAYPAPPELKQLASGATDGEARIDTTLPEGLIAGSAVIDVSIDPHGLAGIEQGLRSLIQYPYGCLEQTTSRLIPLLMVEELAKSLGLAELDGPALQKYIRAGLGKLGTFQTPSGGFSLWAGGTEPELYLTAYALWGMHLAKQAGHPVDEQRVEDGMSWLKRALGEPTRVAGVHNELGELGSRAFALHVLALLGKPEPGYTAKLLEKVDALPRFGLAFLARALGKSLGPTDVAVRQLVDKIVNTVEKTTGGSIVSEPGTAGLYWYMSSDTRTTAIVLDTLTDLRPNTDTVTDLVHGLLSRRKNDQWPTTQDNVFALVALARWARTQEAGSVEGTVTLDGKQLASATFHGKGAQMKHVTIPIGDKQPGPVIVSAKGGKVHFSARLRYQRTLEAQTASSAPELEITHEMVDPETGAPVTSVKVGATVRIRVGVTLHDYLTHLAFVERLPAGLEAVNARFQTSADETPNNEDKDKEARWSRWLSHNEIHDDRVEIFADWLWRGTTRFSFLARATTAGRYVRPAATAEAMYRPEIRARLMPEWLEVKPK